MSEVLSELRYTKTHAWVRLEEDETVTIGITDYAQQFLGEIVHVDLADIEMELKSGDDMGVVESAQHALDVYAPVCGEILAKNEALEDSPELINEDPYGGGWILQMSLADEGEWDELLSADDYEEFLASDDSLLE
jgi:glycine cleavage system H protein